MPEHQEQALRVALGLAAGPPPDRFVVGLAVLSVLAEVARDKPLVVLVDDAQWLDEATCQVLGVVARRLAGRVRPARAWRSARPARNTCSPACRTSPLEGLERDDARALLVAATPGQLDEQVRERLVAETRREPAWRSSSWSAG